MVPFRISRLFVSFLAFLWLFTSTTARIQEETYALCPAEANFSSNSIFESNLDNLLSTLPSVIRADYSGFYNLSYGQDPYKVNAIALCRGDVGEKICWTCIDETIEDLKLCTNRTKQTVRNECMLRYSNESILRKLDASIVVIDSSDIPVPNPNQFNLVVTNLLTSLKDAAASGNSQLKFAIGSANFSNSESVYALMQCTPDLSEAQCKDCLSTTTDSIQQSCEGFRDCRVLTSSCFLYYNTTAFPSLANTATRLGKLQILAALVAILLF